MERPATLAPARMSLDGRRHSKRPGRVRLPPPVNLPGHGQPNSTLWNRHLSRVDAAARTFVCVQLAKIVSRIPHCSRTCTSDGSDVSGARRRELIGQGGRPRCLLSAHRTTEARYLLTTRAQRLMPARDATIATLFCVRGLTSPLRVHRADMASRSAGRAQKRKDISFCSGALVVLVAEMTGRLLVLACRSILASGLLYGGTARHVHHGAQGRRARRAPAVGRSPEPAREARRRKAGARGMSSGPNQSASSRITLPLGNAPRRSVCAVCQKRATQSPMIWRRLARSRAAACWAPEPGPRFDLHKSLQKPARSARRWRPATWQGRRAGTRLNQDDGAARERPRERRGQPWALASAHGNGASDGLPTTQRAKFMGGSRPSRPQGPFARRPGTKHPARIKQTTACARDQENRIAQIQGAEAQSARPTSKFALPGRGRHAESREATARPAKLPCRLLSAQAVRRAGRRSDLRGPRGTRFARPALKTSQSAQVAARVRDFLAVIQACGVRPRMASVRAHPRAGWPRPAAPVPVTQQHGRPREAWVGSADQCTSAL